MSRIRRLVVYHAPLVIYAGIVIALSSMPNLNPPPIRVLAADKLLHFIEYGIFAFLAFRSFSNASSTTPVNHALLFSALFISVFAVFDENFQRFVPGRHFDIYDILTDVGGAILVLLWLWLRKRRKQASNQRATPT